MDGGTPPIPPTVLAAPTERRPVAHGDRPPWSLASSRSELFLTVGERPPLRLSNNGWQDTPAGRRLTMTTADGQVATLTVTHGLCAPAFGTPPGAMIATVAIGDVRLTGCFDNGRRGGDRLYPGR